MKKLYVCGFMFDEAKERVLLIIKKKPDWQAGRINGVGGKVEDGESFKEAMVREFKEEVGIHHEDWECFVSLRNEQVGYRLDFFRAIGPIDDAQKMEEETPIIRDISEMYNSQVIPNLRWLVPLALDKDLEAPIVIQDIGHN